MGHKVINTVVVLVIVGALYFMAVELSQSPSPTKPVSGPPDLIVTPSPLVFDQVPFRGTAEKMLTLQNMATYPIAVREARASCGCMRINFRPITLQAGESKEIAVTMLGDSTPAALKGGVLEFKTSSSTNADIRVMVEAREVFGVNTVPSAIDFGRPEYGQLPLTLPLKIVVNGLGDAEAASIRVSAGHPAFQCGALRRNSTGDYLVDVQLKDIRVVGQITSTLTISGAGFDVLRIPAFASIQHSLRAHPPSVMLGQTGDGEIVVRDGSGEPVQVVRGDVSPSLEGVIHWESPSPGQAHRLAWVNSESRPRDLRHGYVELRVNHPPSESFTVCVPVTTTGHAD
jgi:Protein of unknown function (DUF1573)